MWHCCWQSPLRVRMDQSHGMSFPGRRYPEPSIKGLCLLVPTRNASIWSSILTSFWLACRKALQFRNECSLPTEFHQIGSVSLQALIPLILLPEPDLTVKTARDRQQVSAALDYVQHAA